jgi:hypothetical protein
MQNKSMTKCKLFGQQARKVNANGSIKFMDCLIYISAALGSWDVGLKATPDGGYIVWFGPLCLGRIDVETESFTVMPQHSQINP